MGQSVARSLASDMRQLRRKLVARFDALTDPQKIAVAVALLVIGRSLLW